MMLGMLAVVVGYQILYVRQRVLYAALKHMGLIGARALAGQLRCAPGRRLGALALERRGLHHLAAQRLAQLAQVYAVAVFARHVYHVERYHHRYTQLGQLRGQVQVALYVGRVHYVQYGVGLFVHQIAARHHLLQRIGRQAVYSRQVLYYHILRALELAFLLLHRNAGPVAYVLV